MKHNFQFNSLNDFFDKITQTPNTKKTCNSSSTADPTFRGSVTYEHALYMARHGWPEGLAKMQAAREAVKLPQTLQNYVPQPTISEDGDEILVDRFLDGESDHFLAFPQTQTPKSGRIATIAVNVGGTSKITPASFFNRGAAALALIDSLEAAGIRCEIIICQRSTKNEMSVQWTLTLKRPEDPLELDRLAFFLASTAVQRRFSFRLRELTPEADQWIAANYGFSANIPEEQFPEGTIYFPSPDENLDEEAAAKLALEKLDHWTKQT